MKFKILLAVLAALILVALISPLKSPAEIPFKLGIEYTFVGKEGPDGISFAKVYHEMGATLTKPQDHHAYMEKVQKECGGPFDYSIVDEMVLEYQKYDFEFLIVLATKYDKKPSDYTVEEIECYQEYVRNTVERYDMDGIDDLPGLKYPIIYWQVDSEFGTGFFDKTGAMHQLTGDFWEDPGGEYIKMLRMANPPIRTANPNAKILTIPWQCRGTFVDVEGEARTFDGMPWDFSGHGKQIIEAMHQIMGHPELFDIVTFNSIQNWSGAIGMVRFCKASMASYGYEKPVWMSDLSYSVDPILTGPILLYPYHGNAFAIFQPKLVRKYWKAVGFLNNLAKEGMKGGPNTEWLEKQQAIFVTKTIVVCMGEKIEAMNIHGSYNNLFPWMLFFHRMGGGTFGWTGLAHNDWAVGAYPQRLKEAYFTIKNLNTILRQYTSVECKSSDVPEGKIHRYDFKRDEGSLAVIWLDDRIGQLPGDPMTTVDYTFKEPGVTKVGVKRSLASDTTSLLETLESSSDGSIPLKIDEVPVMIFY